MSLATKSLVLNFYFESLTFAISDRPKRRHKSVCVVLRTNRPLPGPGKRSEGRILQCADMGGLNRSIVGLPYSLSRNISTMKSGLTLSNYTAEGNRFSLKTGEGGLPLQGVL